MTPEYDPCIYHSVQVFGLFRNTFSNLACEAPDAFPEMRRENVTPRGKDPVGANLYIHFPCLYCWRHRQLQRYNIREREAKEQRLSGKFCAHEQRIILMGFSLLERAFNWVFFSEIFAVTKVIIF